MSLNIDSYKKRLNAYKIGTKDFKIDSLKDKIINDFDSNPSFKEVEINHINRGVIITEVSSLNGKPDEKSIITKPGEDILQGDSVLWNSKNWLCIDLDLDNEVYTKGIIKYCNNTLKWQDKDSNIHEHPCILTNKTSFSSDGLEENKYMVYSDSQILITVQNNEFTSKLETNKRIIFNNDKNSIFEVKSIDRLSQDGLIHLIMEKSLYKAEVDRLDLNLADYIEVEETTPDPTTTEIIGSDTIKQWSSTTYTIDTSVTWSVSNSNVLILSQDDQSITLKGEAMGSVILTANDGTNQYTKNIEVISAW